MKNVLIFGANSYIGEAVERWLLREPQKYTVKTIDSITYKDNEIDFSSYQVIFYVAGIAHIKETEENKHLYYQVNRDLTCSVAEKAKKEGVAHFILMSSLSVYGLDSGVIDENTVEKPVSHYGKSKLEADNIIKRLMDNSFKVTFLRPPMVYGKGCKGNYRSLRKLAVKLPFFPKVNNKRSMVFIDNLCDYIEWVIDSGSTGIHIPQNDEYVCTSDMVKLISQANGKKIHLSGLMGCMVRLLPFKIKNKAFGSLICSCKNQRQNFITDFSRTVYLSEESETE